MEKTIEAIRTLHQVLVATALVFFFFVVAPDGLAPYREANLELVRLTAFDRRDYVSDLAERNGVLAMGTRNSLRPLVAAGLPEETIITPLWCELPHRRATVKDWISFANEPRQIVETFVLRRQAEEMALSVFRQHAETMVVRVWFGDSSDLRQQQRFMLGMPQEDCLPLRQSGDRMSLFMVGSQDGGSWSTNQPIDVDVRGSESSHFVSWALRHGWPSDNSTGEVRLLVATARLPELGDRTPEQALFLVEDKLQRASTQLSFLGFSVSNQFLVLAPFVLLFLLSYLIVHVSHAARLAHEDKKSATWVGLFADRISGHFTILSAFVPTVVAIVVVSKLGPQGWFMCVVDVLVVGALTLQSVRLVGEIEGLRKALSIQSLFPPTWIKLKTTIERRIPWCRTHSLSQPVAPVADSAPPPEAQRGNGAAKSDEPKT